MSLHVVKNPMPTVEQMRRFLGVSRERVEAVRRIMEEDDDLPVKNSSSRKAPAKRAAKKSVTSR
jgi:hypothetical protein